MAFSGLRTFQLNEIYPVGFLYCWSCFSPVIEFCPLKECSCHMFYFFVLNLFNDCDPKKCTTRVRRAIFIVFVRFHTIKCIYSHYNLLNQPGLWFFFFLNCLVTNFNVMYLIDSHISGSCDAFLFRNFSISEKSWLIF